MADSVRAVVHLVALGLRDSIVGTVRVLHLDKSDHTKPDENQTTPRQPQEHLSTLARRRAERLRKREPKQDSEAKVLQRILLCCAWNGGVFWLSIVAFNGLMLPALRIMTQLLSGGTHSVSWSWIEHMLSWTFGALWILPLFVLSKVVNTLWFQDIADTAYKRTRGRPQPLSSVAKVVADLLFSLVLQSLFLLQGMLASLLPVPGLGTLVCVVHMCLLHSLYAFEYKWFNMGWEVHKRLSYIESNWPYFVGFGLPLAVLTYIPNSFIISGCVFSILFPLFIVSANEALPIQDVYEFPIQFFAPVVTISNAIFRHTVKPAPPSVTPHRS